MAKPLLMVAQRLAEVLERENDALRAMDLGRAVGLLPEKTAALADLAAADAAPSGPPDPDHASLPNLTSLATRVDRLAMENRQLLERAIVAQKRMIGIIARAAASVTEAPNYGVSGRRDQASRPMALSTRA